MTFLYTTLMSVCCRFVGPDIKLSFSFVKLHRLDSKDQNCEKNICITSTKVTVTKPEIKKTVTDGNHYILCITCILYQWEHVRFCKSKIATVTAEVTKSLNMWTLLFFLSRLLFGGIFSLFPVDKLL